MDIKKQTKKSLLQKCREILQKEIINKQDEQFLHMIIEMHPTKEQKISVGIKRFYIGTNQYKQKCFYIERKDGTTTDFSFIKCISPPTQLSRIPKACRTAIKQQILDAKKNKELIVHHQIKPFKQIFSEWKKQNTYLNYELKKSEDNEVDVYFKDEKTIISFQEYHLSEATLIEVSVKEHNLIHKHKLENLSIDMLKNSLKVLEK